MKHKLAQRCARSKSKSGGKRQSYYGRQESAKHDSGIVQMGWHGHYKALGDMGMIRNRGHNVRIGQIKGSRGISTRLGADLADIGLGFEE